MTHSSRDGPRLAWPQIVTGALGLLVFLGALAVLVHDGLTGGDAPPLIEVRAAGVRPAPGGGHLLEIVVVNRGDETGAAVLVGGALREGGRTVEEAQTTFDYVPAGSERRGGLFFARDPRASEVELGPRGYVMP